MTKTKIAKLLSNIHGVTIMGRGENWKIETRDEKTSKKVFRALRAEKIAASGYQCGWGGWIIDPGQPTQTGEYCDKSSSHHY